MKKRIILAVTSIVLSASLNIVQAAEESRAQTYANQVIAMQDPVKTANVIQGVQGKLAACQQQQSVDCSYYQEILSLLLPVEAQ